MKGFAGPGIEVEVWAMPEDRFGSFVAAVPAPLGIGNATLSTGETVKCFIMRTVRDPGGERDHRLRRVAEAIWPRAGRQ